MPPARRAVRGRRKRPSSEGGGGAGMTRRLLVGRTGLARCFRKQQPGHVVERHRRPGDDQAGLRREAELDELRIAEPKRGALVPTRPERTPRPHGSCMCDRPEPFSEQRHGNNIAPTTLFTHPSPGGSWAHFTPR